MTEWEKDPDKYCTRFWPGWDAKLTPEIKAAMKITDISKLILLMVIYNMVCFFHKKKNYECCISSTIST